MYISRLQSRQNNPVLQKLTRKNITGERSLRFSLLLDCVRKRKTANRVWQPARSVCPAMNRTALPDGSFHPIAERSQSFWSGQDRAICYIHPLNLSPVT